MKVFFLFVMSILFSFPVKAENNVILSCLDFSDSYSKVILKRGKATENDVREMVNLTSLLTGYRYAFQDVFEANLIGWKEDDTDLVLLEGIYRYCLKNPQYSFDKAMRNLPQFVETFKAIRQNEDARCYGYIEMKKTELCQGVQPVEEEEYMEENAGPNMSVVNVPERQGLEE